MSLSSRRISSTSDAVLSVRFKGKIVLQSDVSDLKTKLFKVQLAFEKDVSREDFAELDVLSFTKNGRVVNLIIKGDREKAEAKLNGMKPVFMEVLPLSLEEVFTYEMDTLGYKFEEIM